MPRIAIACLACTLLAAPALADRESVAPGAAVAAKVIGQKCAGALTSAEIGELDAYLAKDAGESVKAMEAKAKAGGYNGPSMQQLQATLTDSLSKKYSDPANCNTTTMAQARDMLDRVRRVTATGSIR